MRNFMDLSRALKGLADAFHTIKLKLDGLYDSAGAIAGNFELIEEITLTEAVALIERTTEPDTTPYSFSDVIIYSSIPGDSETAAQGVYTINNKYGYGYSNTIAAAAARFNKVIIKTINNYFVDYGVGGTTAATQGNWVGHTRLDAAETITSLKIASNPSSVPFPAGSVFQIYAIRK